MPDDQTFTARLQAVKAEYNASIDALKLKAGSDAKRLERRYAQYEQVRKEIASTILEPRLKELANQFPEVRSSISRNIDGGQVTISFPRTPERPALVELVLSVAHDDAFDKVLLEYELHIIPVFIEFEKHSRLALPIDGMDLGAAARWLDDRLIGFAKTYYSMQFIEYYQRDNIATDPVLNRRIPRNLAVASIEHKGATYCFASEESLKMFKADPDKFVRLR